ncbi:hypothetical protein CMV_017654 [Castanea mollissima]|uniref:Uncharacterized protein n=1 Tax=Castanea mollissima TaxID=60419 RepID=A0A8J4VIG0_9ROSI|nr:hypothetical protein CMV_017654 [Castanea mollissima]
MLSLYILLQNCHWKTSPKNLVLVIQKGYLQIHLQRLLDTCTTDHILLEKRKHKAMGSITEENGSVEQRKRKREENQCSYP